MHGAVVLEADTYKLLVESHGIDRDAQDNAGKTALMYAVTHQRKDNAQLLINYGAFLHKADYEGKTTMMHVVISNIPNQKDLVDFLIDKGANVDQQDCVGRTALMYAGIYNRGDSMRGLVEKAINLNIQDHEGKTFLMYMAMSPLYTDQRSILDLLQNRPFDLEVKDHEGKTVLMYGVIYGALYYVAALIQEKADLHAKDYDGRTAYAHAIRSEQFEIADFLKAKGADPNE